MFYWLSYTLQLCTELATQFDTIREEYWNYISRSLNLKYGDDGSALPQAEGDSSKVHTADYIDNLSQQHAKIEVIGDWDKVKETL